MADLITLAMIVAASSGTASPITAAALTGMVMLPSQIAVTTAALAAAGAVISAGISSVDESLTYLRLDHSAADYAQMAVDISECDRILDAARRLAVVMESSDVHQKSSDVHRNLCKVAEKICEQRSQLMMACSQRDLVADLESAARMGLAPSDLAKMMFVDDGFTMIVPTAQKELDDDFVLV